MDNIFKRFTCLFLALLMILEVFSPVTALAAGLVDDTNYENSNSNNVEKKISDEIFNKPAEKTSQKDTRKTNSNNKEEVHKDSSKEPKETGKAPELIPAKKTKNDYEFFENTRKNDNKQAEEKAKAEAEAKAAEEAKAKEEQAAKENADLEKQKQELLRIEAEKQAAAARANEAEAAAAEAEYRDAREKRIELEKLLEEKLKEKGLRDQQKQESEKSLNEEKSNKLEDKKLEEEATEEEQEKGLLEKIKEGLGLTDLQRADKELKKALKNKNNGLEEIQALLDTFEDKYDLSREDQAKLMADNTEAFREFIERHGYENFDPQMFLVLNDDQAENEGLEISDLYSGLEDRELTQEELEAGLTKVELPTLNEEGSGFFRSAFRAVGAGNNRDDLQIPDGKKFNIITRFDTSTAVGSILKGQFFNIHLDDELRVNDQSELKSIYNGTTEIARPTYDKATNTIKYEILNNINENLQIPLNIPVDFNPSKIKLDEDGYFTVINKVSGLGVTDPKDLIPNKVNKYGNVSNQIIEPNRKDVIEVVCADDSTYKVSTDVQADPVIKDRQLVGYNWTIKVSSDTDLKSLGYKANFTTVKGSGLGEITSRDKSVELTDQLGGAFGITDSKHHNPGSGVREVTYNLYTPITNKQAAYMMDVSVILTNKENKLGAKRLIVDEAYGIDKIKEETPSRVGMNNRTTILGEFTSENAAKWTVTDGVSTGDKETNLPLENRVLEGNQTGSIDQTAVYKIDPASGQMVADTSGTTDSKPVGTIAVYEYNSTIKNTESKDPLKLSGVEISKYQDIEVDQYWNLDQGLTMPDMTVKAVDSKDERKVLGEATVDESREVNPDPAERTVTIPNVKVWNIADGGTFTKNDIKIKQEFPTNKKDSSGESINYYETTNWKDPNKVDTYTVHNRGTVQVIPKFGSFTLIKTGEKGKALPGATFKLLGQGKTEVATDSEGKIYFNNIAPGSYQLMETKAPNGYKLNQETTYLTVDSDGGISIQGGSAKLSVGSNPTATVAHGGYPDYMNAMQYATKDKDGNVTTYIFLKANEAKRGGSTDRNTRLSLRMTDGLIGAKDVAVYDVEPDTQRTPLKTAMTQQTADKMLAELGPSVLNVPNDRPISGRANVTDSYTGQEGYQITIDKGRFANDWGFLVVVKSKANGQNPSLTYDWLTDEDTANQAMLRDQTITPTSADEANKDTTITITNEKFETRPVEVTKWDKDKKPVVGATFEIKDANNKVIATVDSQPADAEGKNAGLATFGDLPEGTYTIEEINAPEGYIKSDVIFEVTVDESRQVTYKPKYKNGSGSPISGEDYYIEDIEQDQDKISAKITNVSQSLVINEGDSGDIGKRPQVWEAYMLESLKYNATIDLDNTSPGQRFSIQFDRNLDFTQYFGEFPKLRIAGVDVADPYFDYTTNKLTYVFNEKSVGGKGQAKIELKGIIPSKYYAQNDGNYPFTVTVAPGQTGITGQQTIITNVPADYGSYDYDGNNVQVPQSYYFRDVYQDEKGQWYVKALAYYNPDHIRTSGEKELKFNWLSTNYQGANKSFFTWEGNGNKPAYSLRDVKVYRTSPNMTLVEAGKFDKKVNLNMPLSYGVRPEDDPAKYNLVYSKAIDPKNSVVNDRQGSITLNYDPGQIQEFGPVTKNSPLRIRMPRIDNASKDGYIIEQTFKIDDMNKFNNLWRVFCMTNNDFKSSFVTRANYNKATGDQAGGEIPKFFSQKVALINKKYTPGNFKIKKLNEANREEVLQGASFSLTDENNNTIYRSSGKDGMVEFSKLKPGIYTLREEKAPDKYIKSDKVWRVNVGNDGYVTIIEIGLGSTGETLVGKDTIELPITNKPVATEFTVYKKDNENIPLQGAEFKITKSSDGSEVATGISDKNGTVTFGNVLTKGTYILEETKAPAGYKELNNKWVIEVGDDNKAKVYNYIEPNENTTDPEVNKSILGVEGTKWVDVAKRSVDSWALGDNRQTGWYNRWPVPYKLGTRIVGKNTKDPNNKYVIQRYVINPEADTITLNNASIHREKPWYDNMDWYAGNGVYKIFQLDKAVDGDVEDIRLENYSLTDLTKQITTSKKVISGDNRLYLDFNKRQITKPIVIDVKVPYTSEDGGVGTGMDLYTNKGQFWKSDYYESASQIVEGEPVVTKGEAGNIKGAYVSEGSLDVANDRIVQEFSFKKVDADNQTDALTGATFSLKGPKKSDEDLGPEVWKKSGTDGVVKFDNLTPGIYKLKETGAAQGYENSNTDWTVTVTKDGKIYIRDNNPGSTVPDQSAQWQKVKAGTNGTKGSWTGVQGTPVENRLDTKITEVNPKAGKFRQVYIINKGPEKLFKPYFEIHSQEENRPLNLANTQIVSLVKVGSGSTAENLINPGAKVDYDTQVYVKNNGQERIKITPKGLPDYAEQTLALTIESSLGNSGNIGTGIDFVNYNEANKYWMAEYYNSFNDIQLDPAASTTTDKNATVYVGTQGTNNTNSILSRENAQEAPKFSAYSAPLAKALLTPNIEMDTLDIGDEIVKAAVGAVQDWETVDPSKSEGRTTKAHSADFMEAKITDINKQEDRFKQTFLFKPANTDFTRKIEIHREPEKNNGQLNDLYIKQGTRVISTVKFYEVDANSTIDNVTGQKEITINTKNNRNNSPSMRIKADLPKGKTILVVVESSYASDGTIGLGADYQYAKKPGLYDNTKYTSWACDSYSNEAGVNKNTSQEPVITYKNRTEETTLPFTKQTVYSDQYPEGSSQVTQQGKDGKEVKTYKQKFVNGQFDSEELIDTQRTEPIPEITTIGTKKPQPTYSVSVADSTKLSASPNQGVAEGKEVTVTVRPGADEELDTLTYTYGTTTVNIDKNTKKFNMPAANVTINATFKQAAKTFVVGRETESYGTVKIGPNNEFNVNAEAGKVFSFTVTPINGYRVTGATVTQSNGTRLTNVNFDPTTGQGSFIMPESNVTVRGVYEKIPEGEREEFVEKTETLKHETKVTVDESLNPGDRVVDTPGADGEVKTKYTATYNVIKVGGPRDDVADPEGWPADVIQALKAKKGTNERITAYNKTELSRTEPTTEEVRVGKSDDPIDSFVPGENDKLIKDGETQELVKITNKKAGITPKILKRNPGGDPLPGATFTVNKMTDDTYKTKDTSFGELTATSDAQGNVSFKDQAGNDVKLKTGYYLLEETKAPTGYKKNTADWKIEVKDDGGRMYSEYQGPEDTASSLINDNKKAAAGKSADNASIKYKSRLTYIDPESKTYIQRIYIDTRSYYGNGTEDTKGLLNLQITPKYKREEIDTPGQPPKTIKDGVKTAYRSTYKLSNPATFDSMDDPEIDKILRTYDLSKKDLTMVNTARWRPFDWGFDEDQLNLGKGVYIVDVEGYYDDVIITGESDKADKYTIPQKDLGKIDLNLDFYQGAREFQQLYEKPGGTFGYKQIEKGSYQNGAEALRAWIEKTQGKAKADAWAKQNTEGEKYQNFIGKHVKIGSSDYYTGRVYPALGTPDVKGSTSANLNPLYNSTSHQEIPKEGLKVINEEETYNITFSKHGRSNPDDDVNSEKVTENRLEGAIFKLQVRGPGGNYEDVPGTTVSSAFNGYFGFRGLKPGRYRLLEVKAPQGYKPIKDPVLHFTIAYQGEIVDGKTGEVTPGRGVVTLEYNEGNSIFQYAPNNPNITPEDGKLTDYVTSATAKNMGKIINEVPGKGKVTLTKYDDGKHLLPGAEFRLTRLTRKVTGTDDPKKNDGVYTKVVGDDGTIVFDELPIGQYELEETKPAPGYQNKGKKWRFTVGGEGLDPYINDSEVGIRDISDKVEMTSVMSVVRPDAGDETESEGDSKIHPHKGHALEFKNTFSINDGTVIKPGDYFTIKLTDNIDLDGILKQKSYNLDLFADGVGTIAKAKYDKEAGTLTYVFTSYADQYSKTDFENTITAHINLMKVQNSTKNVPVGMGIGTPTTNKIDVVYDLDMAQKVGINMTSKIVKFDQETGEFVQYYYLNRDRTAFDGNQTFRYKPSEAVTNLRFDLISLDQNGGNLYDYNTGQYYKSDKYVNKDMPESFGINENSNNLTTYKTYGSYNLGANASVDIPVGSLDQNNSVIVKVTGKVTGENIASYDTYAMLYNPLPVTDRYGYVVRYNVGYYVERTNGIRIFDNKSQASAELNIDAINPKNEINFKKVDQAGTILQGAEFKLVKYYENPTDGKNWVEVQGSERTSDKEGLVKYEKLEAGKYALIETKAPKGYGKIEGHIVEFTVGTDGVITRQVVRGKDTGEANSLLGKVGAFTNSVANAITGSDNTETVTEPVSTEPIEVVNNKDIEFVKVDAENNKTTLAKAEFEVYYKENESDTEYEPVKVKKTVDGQEKEVTKTVTSDENGKFSLNLTKPGYYALKESKAPEGYTKMPGYIKEFKLENGKVQTLEKDPLKASNKTSTKGLLTSQIISVDKDKGTFKQRIVINPNHETMTVPSYQSYIRIKENDWKITPKYKDALNKKNGVGGLVNVAILEKGGEKTLANLEEKDFKKMDAISFTTAGNTTGSRYGLKEMLGIETTDDKPITTTDSIVMVFTGKLDKNNNTGTADQLFEIVLNVGIDDSVSDTLNISDLTSDKSAYADYNGAEPIQIENRKAEYPLTGGRGTLIFTLAGLVLMSAAAYVYSRKRGVSYDE